MVFLGREEIVFLKRVVKSREVRRSEGLMCLTVRFELKFSTWTPKQSPTNLESS